MSAQLVALVKSNVVQLTTGLPKEAQVEIAKTVALWIVDNAVVVANDPFDNEAAITDITETFINNTIS